MRSTLESQTISWYIISALFAFGCYGECRRLARWTSEARSAAPEAKGLPTDPWLWIGVSAGSAVLLPTLDCLQRGQLGIAILYFLMLGLRLVLDGRSWPVWLLGGVVLAHAGGDQVRTAPTRRLLAAPALVGRDLVPAPGRPLTQAADEANYSGNPPSPPPHPTLPHKGGGLSLFLLKVGGHSLFPPKLGGRSRFTPRFWGHGLFAPSPLVGEGGVGGGAEDGRMPGLLATTQAAALTAGCAVGGLLFVLVIPAACVGWTKNIEYLHTWTARVVTNRKLGIDSNFDVHSPRNQSFANVVHLWTATPPPPPPSSSPGGPSVPTRTERLGTLTVWTVRALVLVCLAMLGLATGRRGDPLEQAAAYGLACTATLLISPLAWGHYYMIELPAIICLPVSARRHSLAHIGEVDGCVPRSCGLGALRGRCE